MLPYSKQKNVTLNAPSDFWMKIIGLNLDKFANLNLRRTDKVSNVLGGSVEQIHRVGFA